MKHKRLRRNKMLREKITIYFSIFGIISIISWIPFLRPSYSEVEKRELSKFPEFSIESLLNKEYFNGISLWFSDTFPFRDNLITLNGFIKELYGISRTTIYGSPDQGEEIPDNADRFNNESSSGVYENNESNEKDEKEVETDNLETKSLNGVLVVGNSAYEYYSFVKSLADRYITVLNKFTNKVGADYNVYDILVPTSIDIMLPNNFRSTINTSDQKKAISYMFSAMDQNVNKIEIFDTLKSHKDEYLYFRTDHHWTALGAYYAYANLMNYKRENPIPVDDFEKIIFNNYLGSFYSQTGKKPELGNNPDQVIAYKTYNNAEMFFKDKNGQNIKWDIIKDVSEWSTGIKYNTFIGGDNPYTEITNHDIENDNSCVVIKESFGNAFVPFLIPHYKKVYVLDYRYYKESNLQEFVKKNNCKDIIFINNMSATRNASLINRLETLTK